MLVRVKKFISITGKYTCVLSVSESGLILLMHKVKSLKSHQSSDLCMIKNL